MNSQLPCGKKAKKKGKKSFTNMSSEYTNKVKAGESRAKGSK